MCEINKYERTMDQELTSHALGWLAGSLCTLLYICSSDKRADVYLHGRRLERITSCKKQSDDKQTNPVA